MSSPFWDHQAVNLLTPDSERGQEIDVPYGYCHCGCGEKTRSASKTMSKRGWIKGEPIRFIFGHNGRVTTNKGENHYNWKGGRRPDDRGYISGVGRKREHVVIAEEVLGKPLPPGANVHHVNNDKSDNRKCNLVICQDIKYHNLLHRREIAINACGHPTWRQCCFCHKYDDPQKLVFRKNGSCLHNICEATYARGARKRRKNK